MGTGDELRASFVLDGIYWGAAGFLREEGDPPFTSRDVGVLTSLTDVIGELLRRATLVAVAPDGDAIDAGPGVVVYDEHGEVESISPAAELWISEMIEVPRPLEPAQSKAVQAVAARARSLQSGDDPLGLEARSRVRTRSGRWLLLCGTRLSGGGTDRTAVVMQPAPSNEVAPIVALVYGLTPRERDVTQLCMGWSVDQAHGAEPRCRGLHRSGPPEVHLRQDRRTHPWRTRRTDLPRALHPAMGAGRSHGRVACSHRRSGTIDRARLTQRGLVREGCGQRSPTPSRTVPRRQVPAGRTFSGEVGPRRR